MRTARTFNKAFTIVELTIVIVVMGILAGIIMVSYGNWQTSLAQKAVQSDLQMAASAMENAKNFSSGYPILSQGDALPQFKASSNVTVTYYSGSATTFCIDAVYTSRSSVHYFIDTSLGKKPIAGTCENGEEIPGQINPVEIAAGGDHTCVAKSNGSIYCWGAGGAGQLGRGSTSDSSSPVAVTTSGVLAGKTVKAMSAGYYYSCVIASDDRVYCWGTTPVSNSNVPTAAPVNGALTGKTTKAIGTGFNSVCVIASDNLLYCWGTNTYGQLGNGTTNTSSSPVAVSTSGVLAGKTIKAIASGTEHNCVIASDDKVYCWGAGDAGQLGNGTTNTSSSPVAVSTSGVLAGKTIKAISAGNKHTCAVTSEGLAYCWGSSPGNGSGANSSSPVAVSTAGVLTGKTIKAITSGNTDEHTCAIASDNQAYCWGSNGYGQLGNGTTSTSSAPVAVSTSGVLTGKTAKYIANGKGHSCMIASDKNVYCWGEGWAGKLGNGGATNQSSPVAVPSF